MIDSAIKVAEPVGKFVLRLVRGAKGLRSDYRDFKQEWGRYATCPASITFYTTEEGEDDDEEP